MIRTLFAVALSFVPALLAQDGSRFTEDFKMSYQLNTNGRFSLESFNGSIEITGWERNEVEIVGTKYASSEDLLKEIKIDTTNTPESVSLRAYRPKSTDGWWGSGNSGVKMTVRVPRKVQLERVSSSNGGVRIESIEGNARISTSNGSVRVANLTGSLDASTSNGKLEVIEIKGSAILKTSNGTIQADSVTGSLEATTTNGAIRARIDKASAGTPVRATSSNGAIDLTFQTFNANEVRVSTSNGAITVRLPEKVNAELRASTSNSRVQSDYDVTVRGTISKNRLEGKLGEGGAMINLSSSNSPIRIQKLM